MRLSNISKFLFPVFAILLVALFFYSFDNVYGYKDIGKIVEFRIQKGESVNLVAKNLEKQGLLDTDFWFKYYVVLSGNSKAIKPGRYLIGPRYSVVQLVDKFTAGEADIKVRIQEGWSNLDIAEYLESKGVVRAEKFFDLSKNFDNSEGRFEFLPPKKGVDLEGYLFPDSYKFYPFVSIGFDVEEEIIDRMLDNFDKKVYRKLFSNSGNSNSGKGKGQDNEKGSEDKGKNGNEEFLSRINEIITMASLIENEVRGEEDKRLIAGILWKRIDAGIPLQVDATLVYIKCELLREGKGCRLLSREDKKIDSPYNTYLYKGLPPGPISNPGFVAVKAALNPKPSPYWYYLSAKEDGRTIFAKTLEEHNLNRVRYR